jgi:class 3 adenylate cyclase
MNHSESRFSGDRTAAGQRRKTEWKARELVLVAIDLAGYRRAFQVKDDEGVAAFLDDYYAVCVERCGAAGGSVVKFMGDGCLLVFSADLARQAVAVVVALAPEVSEIAARHGLALGFCANLHLGRVLERELEWNGRVDIVGRAVNQTFLMGRGEGIRLSEPVYRKLESGVRSPWRRHKPPALYELQRS